MIASTLHMLDGYSSEGDKDMAYSPVSCLAIDVAHYQSIQGQRLGQDE